jgi:hypothetical protein
MEAERWKQVDELLQSALLLPCEKRDEFLRQACAGDADWRRKSGLSSPRIGSANWWASPTKSCNT